MNPEQDGLEAPVEDTPGHPDWLDTKYQTAENPVEAQAQAYAEARKAMQEAHAERDRERQERERIEERLDELTTLVQQQQAPQGQFDPMSHPLIAGAQQALDNGDVVGLMAAFQELARTTSNGAQAEPQSTELDPYFVNQVHQNIAAQYNADEQMTAEALRIMESDPLVSRALNDLSESSNPQIGDLVPIVDAAYRLASGATAQVRQEQSLAQQQAEQEAARQRKIDAETERGSGPTRVASPDEMKSAWERIVNAPTEGIRLGRQ